MQYGIQRIIFFMIAIISDIHGNYEALKQVLSVIDSMGISKIVCLGDVVGYYTQINECCNELRSRNVRCVMGNHDWYMASGSSCPRSKSANDCMAYQRKIILRENRDWISSFPPIIKEEGISMVHGGWSDPIDEYLLPKDDYFENISGHFFASGHSHVQCIYQFGDKTYCNPGSVGQPRDGDSRAAFACFDGEQFELFRVAYDIDRVGELMKQAGFSPYYYGCLRDGARRLHC